MAQVAAHQAQFEAANLRVVTLSFGTDYWSRVWLEETKSPFPYLLDPEREAYRAYGLRSSAWRSWSLPNLLYYARARLQGRETYGFRGDSHQLGGDFVVDKNGRIQLAHPSRNPTDRPSIKLLLQTARAAQNL